LNLRDAAHFQRGLFNMVGAQFHSAGASVLLMVLVSINIASLLANMQRDAVAKSLSAPALGATRDASRRRYFGDGLLALAGATADGRPARQWRVDFICCCEFLGVPLSVTCTEHACAVSCKTAAREIRQQQIKSTAIAVLAAHSCRCTGQWSKPSPQYCVRDAIPRRPQCGRIATSRPASPLPWLAEERSDVIEPAPNEQTDAPAEMGNCAPTM